MNSRERVLRALRKESVDRPPVLCVNSTATQSQLEKSSLSLPEVHQKAEPMAQLALGAFNLLGFDAVRVPFCQTIEAEALGCQVNYKDFIPRTEDSLYQPDDLPKFPEDFLSRGRIPELIRAINLLKKEVEEEVLILGGVVGPLTIARSLLDSVPMLKASLRTPDKLRPFLEVGNRVAGQMAIALLKAGADAIVIEDMAASPNFIHPKTYKTMVLHHHQRLIGTIPGLAILHICGDISLIAEEMAQTKAGSLSIEPKATISFIREKVGEEKVLIGGVDAPSLFISSPSEIWSVSLGALKEGIDLLAPGCAVPTNAPTENLRAMVQAAIDFGPRG
ncbi:MAG: uroporphyrinogen decarboxylase family protein [Thermodesulfobacteriota bacterium]